MKEFKLDKSLCCGCGVCVLSCPKDCLVMRESRNGFSYPNLIKVDACIQCNLCKTYCDFNSNKTNTDVKAAYIAASREKTILYKSSSGGIFYQFARYFLNDGGVVYGAAFIDLQAKHIRVEHLEQLEQLLGSKYVESELGDIFLKVKEDLLLQKKVLFAGTGCQVNSLHKYIGNHENLFLFEILCHGVPSKKLLELFIKDFEKKNNVTIKNIEFRSKEKYGWTPPTMNIYTNRKKFSDAAYFYSFNRGFGLKYFNRESCFNCPYTYLTTKSDVIVGDYWNSEEEFYDTLGMSFIILKSSQAEDYFSIIRKKIDYNTISVEQIAENNKKLIMPSKKPLDYINFWNDFYKHLTYSDLVKKYRINLKLSEKVLKKLNLFIKKRKTEK